MRIVTWNINSLRLRLPLLNRLIEALRPDVLCLQETKVPDELFPADGVAALGFAHTAMRGMKGYNGVAVLSRLPLAVIPDTPRFGGKEDCRHLLVRVEAPGGPVDIHDFYVPAGGDVPDPAVNPKFAHKLAFVDEAALHFASAGTGSRTVLVGDLNIAPGENDVWSHRQLLGIVSHTPAETAKLESWRAAGFVDAARRFVPDDEKLFTWWSYRNRDWRLSNRGRRLDHIWTSPDLVPAYRDFTVHAEARDWPACSDHVPVMLDLAL